MTTLTTSHFATMPPVNSSEEQAGGLVQPRPRWDARVPVGIALGVGLAASVALIASLDSTLSRLRALPPAERAAVLERAVGNLRDVCRESERPREFCRAQAELALALPECAEACQSLAREELRADSAVK